MRRRRSSIKNEIRRIGCYCSLLIKHIAITMISKDCWKFIKILRMRIIVSKNLEMPQYKSHVE